METRTRRSQRCCGAAASEEKVGQGYELDRPHFDAFANAVCRGLRQLGTDGLQRRHEDSSAAYDGHDNDDDPFTFDGLGQKERERATRSKGPRTLPASFAICRSVLQPRGERHT